MLVLRCESKLDRTKIEQTFPVTGRKLVADARLDGAQIHFLVFLLKHTTTVQRCTSRNLESMGQLDCSFQLNMHQTMQTCLIDEEERGEEQLQTGVIKQSHTSVPVSTRNRLARQKVVAADESLAKAVVLASDERERERERERESERGEGRRGATDHTDAAAKPKLKAAHVFSEQRSAPPPLSAGVQFRAHAAAVCRSSSSSSRSGLIQFCLKQQQQQKRRHNRRQTDWRTVLLSLQVSLYDC